ncbi:imidazole glycerol phosphate synthase [Pseudidiomarina salinarum]|uniref:Imidazole glycerol phosphate synthase subunit HisH n=1 Tax=Pseudidiomarina salinarum TaxID=435908 RepID=A0A094J0K9_9GAMM|nr:imidazole glycerol phosphate synthase subunit HisH [Pseudidiomarina salinarum]KFZ31614.1 imidazole glycerol phosphate synthase [Pseudidiomarina salinarum]RUO70618.1 imidazole glycerol phosphate synthase subunit HisH [Pseudidiomarina salinarum]
MNLVIIDTACANLTSVRFAIERLGVIPEVTADAARIQQADRVILPGVGTARAAMRNLQQLELVPVIRELQQPVLGICLGMQLLTDWSAEGDVDCLGVIPARTERLQAAGLPLPHMGWNTLQDTTNNPLTRGLGLDPWCYFVHSFAVAPDRYTIARTNYGATFAAMIRNRNFFGAQFHPERSGATGSRILKNFLEITDADTST